MENLKFRADLLSEIGQIPGHIIISDEMFSWKPMVGNKRREFELPIHDVVGYSKSGFSIWSHLYLKFDGYDVVRVFWAWSVKSIINALIERNPYIRRM